MQFLRIRKHWARRAIGSLQVANDIIDNAPSMDIGHFENGARLYMHRYSPSNVQFIIEGKCPDRRDLEEITTSLQKGLIGLVQLTASLSVQWEPEIRSTYRTS